MIRDSTLVEESNLLRLKRPKQRKKKRLQLACREDKPLDKAPK
jgi:hypothetical protein